MDQIQAFLKAAQQNRKMELYEEAVIMRAATQAIPRDFERLLRKLRQGLLEDSAPKPATKANVQVLKMFFGGKYKEAAKAMDRSKD